MALSDKSIVKTLKILSLMIVGVILIYAGYFLNQSIIEANRQNFKYFYVENVKNIISEYFKRSPYIFQLSNDNYGILDQLYFYLYQYLLQGNSEVSNIIHDNGMMIMQKISVPIITLKLKDSNYILYASTINSITLLWDQAKRDLFILFVLIAALLVIIYVIIRKNLNIAQKVIQSLTDENTMLIEAKVRAENESLEKSKFLANVSHELRTPLNAIIGFSDIIKSEANGPLDNEFYKDYINDINVSGTHLLSLINDILDYSKASAEELQVEMIKLDARKIVMSSTRLVIPRATGANVEIKIDLPQVPLIMNADPKRFKQALLNILSNSVKFTPSGGQITVKAYLSQNSGDGIIIIEITDTGIGIADQDIPKAMSVFGQIDSKLSRKYEGTGIGLPFTKILVELMKGEFAIRSKLGIGTTITMSFAQVQINETLEI